MAGVKTECEVADLRSKVEKAPNLEILRQYVLKVLDTCPISISGEPAKKAKGSGKKRAPSAYNLYIKECMPRLKEQGMPQEHRMKKCADEFKAKKGK